MAATVQITMDKFVEILEHNKANNHDTDIWLLLDEDGNTAIVPDQNIAEFQNPQTWPKYICRSEAVNTHVSADGLYAALDHVNWAIGLTMSAADSRLGRSVAVLARALSRSAGVSS